MSPIASVLVSCFTLWSSIVFCQVWHTHDGTVCIASSCEYWEEEANTRFAGPGMSDTAGLPLPHCMMETALPAFWAHIEQHVHSLL